MRNLYYLTLEFMAGDQVTARRGPRIDDAKANLRARLTDWSAGEIDTHLARGYPGYWLTFDTDTHVRHAGIIRDAVRVLSEEDGWSHIEWNNRRGYVPTSALSNLWIRVDKSDRLVYVYKGAELIRTYPVDVSISDEDKVRLSGRNEQNHWRIPEGVFFVARKNPNSRYYRAFVISYPNQAHAARGLRDGLISRGEYDAIVRADMAFREPPMGTPLGGLIEIHGNGSGRQRAWTRGCVALRNVHMSELWDWVHVGTPVIIEQ